MAGGNEVYSYSRLSTLDGCPRAYEFKYVRKVREAFTSVEAFLGRTVHETLGWLYEERERSGAPEEAHAVERFDADWDGAMNARVRVVRRDDSVEARREAGREMVRRYHRGPFRRDALRTLGIERRYDLDLDGGRRYRGIVDRLAEGDDGELHVVDFKTTGRPPAVHGDEQTLQLRSYGLAVLRHHDVGAVRLSYRYLANGTTYDLRVDAREAERTAGDLVARIDRAERTTAFPPSPSALCAWCGYREDCDVSGFAPGRGGGAGDASGPSAGESCPRCAGTLRHRDGRFGPFLGCSNFPRCRYTRNP